MMINVKYKPKNQIQLKITRAIVAQTVFTASHFSVTANSQVTQQVSKGYIVFFVDIFLDKG